MSTYPEGRLKNLEDSAYKERRELETRQNAEELHRYLDFGDVDWSNIGSSDFEIVNFELERNQESALNDVAEFIINTKLDYPKMSNFRGPKQTKYRQKTQFLLRKDYQRTNREYT
jgi:hypothetical protein